MDQDIHKICKIHGKLTKDLIHPKGKSKTGKQYYGCLLCKRETQKKFYRNNFESAKKSSAEYHQKRKLTQGYKEKKKVWMHNYQKRRRSERGDELRTKEKVWRKRYYDANTEIIKQHQKDMALNASKPYVKSYLKKYFKWVNPSNELIEAKSLLLKLRREIMKRNYYQGRNKYVHKTEKYPRRNITKDERTRLSEPEENIKKDEM